MSRDAILTDADGVRYSFDHLTIEHWLRGHVSGAEAAVAWLIEQGVEHFRAGRIDRATELHRLALQLKAAVIPPLEARVREHERAYPSPLADLPDPAVE